MGEWASAARCKNVEASSPIIPYLVPYLILRGVVLLLHRYPRRKGIDVGGEASPASESDRRDNISRCSLRKAHTAVRLRLRAAECGLGIAGFDRSSLPGARVARRDTKEQHQY